MTPSSAPSTDSAITRARSAFSLTVRKGIPPVSKTIDPNRSDPALHPSFSADASGVLEQHLGQEKTSRPNLEILVLPDRPEEMKGRKRCRL